MKTHDLKTWPNGFDGIWFGFKYHEIRHDDRGFDVGDCLVLREWWPDTELYSGRLVRAEVTYISRGPDWGLPSGMVVMSIRELSRTVAGPKS